MSLSLDIVCCIPMDLPARSIVVGAVAVVALAAEPVGSHMKGNLLSPRVHLVSQSLAQTDQNSEDADVTRRDCDRVILSRIRLSEGMKELLATCVELFLVPCFVWLRIYQRTIPMGHLRCDTGLFM